MGDQKFGGLPQSDPPELVEEISFRNWWPLERLMCGGDSQQRLGRFRAQNLDDYVVGVDGLNRHRFQRQLINWEVLQVKCHDLRATSANSTCQDV